MNKRLATILACFAMLAVSAILLLTFLIDKKEEEEEFYCTAQNVNLCLGESAYNYYQISHPLSIINISVDKANIIDIDNEKITAVGIGTTNVTLSASYGDKKSETTFTVKVSEQNYTISFTPTANCYFEGNTIYVQSKTCQFSFEICNSQNIQIEVLNYDVIIEGEGKFAKNFCNITLSLDGNCKITLSFPDLEFEFSIQALLNEG